MLHSLPVQGPLDLALTFGCGQAFRWRPDGEGWSGVVAGAEARVSWEIPGARLRLETRGADPGAVAWSRYLRLEEDPRVHLAGAEPLRALPGFEPLLGLRLLRQEPWETLASFIGSAAANIPKITTCVEGLAARYGEPIEGADRRAFPAAAAIARRRERDLRGVGLGFRAPYLLATARRLDATPLDWEGLREAPIEEARARLVELPGIGAKIADCVLLFGLGRLDAYPVDRWIRRATLELAGRRRANDRELGVWAERLGPGRGYLQQILFHLRRTGGPFPPLAAAPPVGSGARRARQVAGAGTSAHRSEMTGDAIALFAKAPRAGSVKTRLCPPLTETEAAEVARVCLESTLSRFPAVVPGAWTLFLEGDPEPWLERLAAGRGVRIAPQGPGDLGARLSRAFRTLHAAGARRAVAIGSDSPTLDPARIAAALDRLDHADAVLGPARDGGYYLVGVRPGREALFDAIPWSTARVAAATRRRAAESGWTLAELPEWYDVDDAKDLRRAASDADACPELARLVKSLEGRL